MIMQPKIAVVGATGAVGEVMLAILAEHGYPAGQIVAVASQRSAGGQVDYGDTRLTIQSLADFDFTGIDYALFSAGGSISKEFAPLAARAGAVVIDNTSAFRYDDAIPLVVPEVNASALKDHQGFIANPNCSTIIALTALGPLHAAAGLRRFVASTYQAVSGSGSAAVRELEAQVRAWAEGRPLEAKEYGLVDDVITPRKEIGVAPAA